MEPRAQSAMAGPLPTSAPGRTAGAHAGSGDVEGGRGVLPEPEVRAMFDRIAGLYDRMNTVMTAGLHHRWRRRAADLAAVGSGSRALDVATGTGDLAIAVAERVGDDGEVGAVDCSERMRELAGAK